MTPTATDLRLEQLRIAAPPALEMLLGNSELDAIVVLSALEAAGLLDPLNIPERDSASIQDLRAETNKGGRIRSVLEMVDWSPETNDLSHASAPDDLERRFEALLAWSGVQTMLPPRSVGPVAGLLERNALWADDNAEALDLLIPLLDACQAELDLPPHHPAVQLIDGLLSTHHQALSPAPAVDWDGAWRVAEARVRVPVWSAWAERLSDAFSELRELLTTPVPTTLMAAAATEFQSAEFVVLADRGTSTLVLQRQGGALMIGWAGEGPPPSEARFHDGAAAMDPVPRAAEGNRLWWLPSPPDGPVVIELRWNDGTVWAVPVGDDSES